MSRARHDIAQVARALLVLLVLSNVSVFADDTSPTLAEWARRIETAQIDPAAARSVAGLSLALGPARVTLIEGTVFPTTPVGGAPREFVFLGKARFQLDPPDEIEAQQFELFTHARRIDVEAQELVFVASDPVSVTPLLALPQQSPTEAQNTKKAADALARWRDSPEREGADVLLTLVSHLAGESGLEALSAVRVRCQALPEFTAFVNPRLWSPVGVVRFVPSETDEVVAFRVRAAIARERREGRALSFRADRLGTLDTWGSWGDQENALGRGAPTNVPEPSHYELRASIDGESGRIAARATLSLDPPRRGLRTLRLEINPDLTIRSVVDGHGRVLDFHQVHGAILVAIAGSTTEIDVFEISFDYDGVILERVAFGAYSPWQQTYWYPHTGQIDLATYGVSLEWPSHLQVIGGGRQLSEVENGKKRQGRWTIDTPYWGFGFEIGQYEITERRSGSITVRFAEALAMSPRLHAKQRDEIVNKTVSTIEDLETLLGPYPLSELTLVGTPRRDGRWQGSALHGLAILDEELLRHTDVSINIAESISYQWTTLSPASRSRGGEWIQNGMSALAGVHVGRAERRRGTLISDPSLAAARDRLARIAKHGRPIGETGPLSLGYRLDSSLCDDCATTLCFYKGAMVLDAIRRAVGPEKFAQEYSKLLASRKGTPLSTRKFLAHFQSDTEVELEAIRAAFVDGVGLPSLLYHYDLRKVSDSSWNIDVDLHVLPAISTRLGFWQLPVGSLDFRRVPVISSDSRISGIRVPYLTTYYKADDARLTTSDRREAAESRGNMTRVGEFALPRSRGKLSLSLEYPPRRFEIDPESLLPLDVEDYLFNRARVLTSQALEAWARGDRATADSLFREAISTEIDPAHSEELARRTTIHVAERGRAEASPSFWKGRSGKYLEDYECRARVFAYVRRAELALEEFRLDTARESISSARELARSCETSALTVDALVATAARVLMRDGEVDGAAKLVWKSVADGEYHSTYLWGVTAVVAHATGDDELKKKALDKLEDRHVDVSILKAAR